MAFKGKPLPVESGVGELRYPGFRGPVRYDIKGDPAKLKAGYLRLHGSLTATPEIAEAVFREGESVLVLADGSSFRLIITGHSAGADVAYFELRA